MIYGQKCTTKKYRNRPIKGNEDQKAKKTSRKNQKEQKYVLGKMKHNKQENTLGNRDSQINSQQQKLESAKGFAEKQLQTEFEQQKVVW